MIRDAVGFGQHEPARPEGRDAGPRDRDDGRGSHFKAALRQTFDVSLQRLARL